MKQLIIKIKIMKQLKTIAIGVIILLSFATKAQVSVNVNIGSPPLWGPVGYAESRYYYLPDVEAYYDVESSMFIYYGGGVWIHNAYLPGRYRNYDLYNGYKVVITDYRGCKSVLRKKYSRFNGINRNMVQEFFQRCHRSHPSIRSEHAPLCCLSPAGKYGEQRKIYQQK